MKAFLVAAAFVFAATAAQAESCKMSSAKLSGAAKTSHKGPQEFFHEIPARFKEPLALRKDSSKR